MTDTQYYTAEIHVRTTAGDLVTYYPIHGPGPAGIPATEIRAAAEAAALAQEPGGKVEGSRVSRN
ncbi:hypothetical protein ACIGXM_03700 [Kitasatospora sp. NPDC052896]|uniref:hypothetical protein n=1 Tax=Kitasatospora sp. NPDC052896 TaxID=3364061 RepID=UPI0037CB9A73